MQQASVAGWKRKAELLLGKLLRLAGSAEAVCFWKSDLATAHPAQALSLGPQFANFSAGGLQLLGWQGGSGEGATRGQPEENRAKGERGVLSLGSASIRAHQLVEDLVKQGDWR